MENADRYEFGSLIYCLNLIIAIIAVWMISDQNAYRELWLRPHDVCFSTECQLSRLAVLCNPESELCGLSWCKQMVSALMTSFWSQPDMDSGCQMRFPNSTEVRWPKRFEICGLWSVNKGPGPISWEKFYLDNHYWTVWRVSSSNAGARCSAILSAL